MDAAQPNSAATRMAPERERALVHAARTDPRAFAELYDYYLPRIYGFIHRRVQERPVAEDITATTFQRGLEALRRGTFRNDSFGGWLYRVAANSVVDHVRSDRRVIPIDPEGDGSALADGPSFEAFTASVEREELREAMHRLPETHRRVLLLRFFDDMDIDEVCSVLGCSRRTFAVKLHRAIAALRGVMLSEATDAA
jgi:RNA polymerase sigma-70 factor, ECF subfamily